MDEYSTLTPKQKEQLKESITTLAYLMPADLHSYREEIQEEIEVLKALYIGITAENPWR